MTQTLYAYYGAIALIIIFGFFFRGRYYIMNKGDRWLKREASTVLDWIYIVIPILVNACIMLMYVDIRPVQTPELSAGMIRTVIVILSGFFSFIIILLLVAGPMMPRAGYNSSGIFVLLMLIFIPLILAEISLAEALLVIGASGMSGIFAFLAGGGYQRKKYKKKRIVQTTP